MPREILKVREGEKKEKEGQQTLDGVFCKSKPKEFLRSGVLKAVAEFVMCDNQVHTLLMITICAVNLQNVTESASGQ